VNVASSGMVSSSEIETALVTYKQTTSSVVIFNNVILAYVGSLGVAADRT